MSEKNHGCVDIYTDGACSGNPGPGGWGAILRVAAAAGGQEKEMCGDQRDTTNNRMELTAVIEALRATGYRKRLEFPAYTRLAPVQELGADGSVS